MRKRRKKMAAVILAAGMAVTGNGAAYGAAAGNVESVVPGAAAALGSATTTTISGKINVTTVSVTVPLTAAFDIDPNTYDGAVGTQITGQSADYKITNNSAAPVWVYISKVEETDVTLVNNTAALSGDKTMMLAIKKNGTATTSAVTTPGFWMTPATVNDNTGKYVLDPDSAADKGKIASGASMSLELYGLTQKGWAHDDGFTIKPSFMITVSDPTL